MVKQKVGLLPITNDYVFKRVFSYEGNEDVLIDLLEAILKRKINSIEVKNPEILSEKIEGKKFVLDIKAELDDETFIDVEMQTVNEHNIGERSIAYTARIVSEQLKAGEEYINLNKVIFIGILNFEYYKRNTYHHIARMRFDKIQEEDYIDMVYKQKEEMPSDYIEEHYIELTKYFLKDKSVKTKLDEWLCLFSGDEEKMKVVERKNKKIKKAMNTLKMLSLNQKEREMYEAIQMQDFLKRVGENNLKKEVFAEGITKGKLEEKKKIAKKLLNVRMDIKQIEEVTGLTENEIEVIKNEM